MIMNICNLINGNKDIKKLEKIADKIEKLDKEMQHLTDEQLKDKTNFFKKEINSKKSSLDDILVPAFAVAREAAYRVLKQKPFYVQLLGAIALHNGDIAEMKTGEGKTLTSILPAYLNSLTGKGVHIVTVNNYLAERDSTEMGRVHNFLGVSVGWNHENLSQEAKKESYNCDITYSTNSELGFDYLRDNMVLYSEHKVQRGLNYAIIDEADSILIDEAKTPLIIGGGHTVTIPLYIAADKFAKSLKKEIEFEIDLSHKSVTLTKQGIRKAEKFFNTTNIFSIENTELVHKIMQSLKANYIFNKNVDYLVKDSSVFIVDQFTGRILDGRRYSDGLHQALECKENVQIKEETKVMATTTYQNFFRLYTKIAGMTGTAKTEEEEFLNTYNMRVSCIRPNKKVIREDKKDIIYGNLQAKYNALVQEIINKNKKGQPVLVGTVSVESSEIISKMLKKRKIKHNVLNAKYHEKEAEIIAQAGQKSAITIATNMAGRGTDIKLGKGVRELGGLAVIGSERHESRRIDNQLRGRSGRQGDPGESIFYLSFEDDLMKRFGNQKLIKRLMSNLLGDEPLSSEIFSKQIESSQKQVEGINYDIRKNTLQYDDILRIQRQNIYKQRDTILGSNNIDDLIRKIITFTSKRIIEEFYKVKVTKKNKIKRVKELFDTLNKDFGLNINISEDTILKSKDKDFIKIIEENLQKAYADKQNEVEKQLFDKFQKAISLNILDKYWIKHLEIMNRLKSSISLRGYAQRNPLYAYQEEAYDLYNEMLYNRDYEIIHHILKEQILDNLQRKDINKNKTKVTKKIK